MLTPMVLAKNDGGHFICLFLFYLAYPARTNTYFRNGAKRDTETEGTRNKAKDQQMCHIKSTGQSFPPKSFFGSGPWAVREKPRKPSHFIFLNFDTNDFGVVDFFQVIEREHICRHFALGFSSIVYL